MYLLCVADDFVAVCRTLIGLQRDFLALPCFAACLVCLVVSIYFSIRDITVSLAALELEVSERMRGD